MSCTWDTWNTWNASWQQYGTIDTSIFHDILRCFMTFMICHDVLWYVMVCHDISWHFVMVHDMSLYHVCFSMICQDVLYFWLWLFYGIAGHFMMFHDTSWYVMVLQDISWCFMMFHDMSWYCRTFHDVSWCFMRLSIVVDLPLGIAEGRELLQRTVRRRSSGAVPGSCTKEGIKNMGSYWVY